MRHPSRIGAKSGAEDRVEAYLDEAPVTLKLSSLAVTAVGGALCVALLDLADAIREHGDTIADPLKTIGMELGQVSIAIKEAGD